MEKKMENNFKFKVGQTVYIKLDGEVHKTKVQKAFIPQCYGDGTVRYDLEGFGDWETPGFRENSLYTSWFKCYFKSPNSEWAW